MAIIRYGAMITDLRGKLGGHFFSSGQGGAVMSTNGQRIGKTQSYKKLWGYIKRNAQANTQTWQELTDAQRAAWAAEAANWPTINRVGDTAQLRGYSLFLKVNGILNTIGVASLSIPAPKTSVSMVSGVTINTLSATVFRITPTLTLSADEVCVVCATRSMSSARVPSPKDFRIITWIPDTAILPADIFSSYEDIFGAPLVNGYVNVKCYVVNKTNGQTSVENFTKKIVS